MKQKRTKREHTKRKSGRLPLIGDILFSLLTIPTGLGYVESAMSEQPEQETLYISLLLAVGCMIAARLFRAFRLRRRSRLDFYRFLAYGAILLAAFVCAAVDDRFIEVIAYAYWATLLADRAISIVRRPRVRNILLNATAIIVFVMFFIGSITIDQLMIITMIFAAFHGLLTIMKIAFSRINVRVLMDIIRQTYAMEIMLGLLLLIVAFSYVLKFTEPNTPTLGDALWYCFAIVTTIGFGDITASSIEGRILSVILGVYGIVVVSLITSVIVNFYGEMKREVAIEEGAQKEEGEEKEKTEELKT